MNYAIDKTLTWIGNNKLATFFGFCLFIFVIVTIVLASQKNSLEDQLASCKASKQDNPKDPQTPGGDAGGPPIEGSNPDKKPKNNGMEPASFKLSDYDDDYANSAQEGKNNNRIPNSDFVTAQIYPDVPGFSKRLLPLQNE